MTKAERIFKNTKYHCMTEIERFGVMKQADGKVVGFEHLDTEESTCTRTYNEIQKLIDRERKNNKLAFSVKAITAEKYALIEATIDMVQSTLDNHVYNYNKW